MSLLVWLPLTKGFDNQGLSGTTFYYLNNNGKLVANASGKLGGCYERIASNYADTIRSDVDFNLTDDITMMCWAYVSATVGDTANGLITNHNHNHNSGVGITVKQVSTSDYRICCSTGTGSSRTYNTYYGTTNIKDAWHHLALTYSRPTQQLKLWVDGVVEYTLNNYNNGSDSSPFDIFNWSTGYYTNASFRPVCKLNDVRLYDSCLSTKEIKEIAKGLVCHYKLADCSGNANPNRLNLVPKSYNPTAYNAYQFNMTENLVAGETYTIQLWDVDVSHSAKSASNLGVWVFWGGGSISLLSWSGTSYFTDGHADYLVKTFTVTASQAGGSGATNLWLNIYNSVSYAAGTMDMTIGRWKLEKGSTATAYAHTVAEMGGEDTTIYDSSGLNNHMTAYGSPTISTNTVRNSVSTHFTNGQYLMAQYNSTSYLPTDAITVNLWMYCTTWGNPISCTEGGGFNFENNSGLRFQLYVNNVGYKPADSGVAINSLLNTWHMLTGTFDKTSVKIYIDGELKATTATGSTTNGIKYVANRLVIAAEAQTTTPASSTFVGEISDVRIYATALSDEDIMQLYNAPVSVSNNGMMFTQGEFVEV